MAARIFAGGRLWYASPGFPSPGRSAVAVGRSGRALDGSAIPPTSSASPFRDGVTLVDPEEGLTYRCVHRLDPLTGWAPTEFWQERWQVDHRAIVDFASAGWLDAAVEAGSQVRRFRVRDEVGLLAGPEMKKAKFRLSKRPNTAKLAAERKAHRAAWRAGGGG